MPELRWNSPAIMEALVARAPFSVSNFLATTEPTAYDQLGHLPQSFRNKLGQQLIDCRVTYVVYSYETPIAWVVDGHTVVIPDVRYSLTTGKHQKLVREHLGTPAGSVKYTVTWDHKGETHDSICDTEEDRNARIVELVLSGMQNVRIETNEKGSI